MLMSVLRTMAGVTTTVPTLPGATFVLAMRDMNYWLRINKHAMVMLLKCDLCVHHVLIVFKLHVHVFSYCCPIQTTDVL